MWSGKQENAMEFLHASESLDLVWWPNVFLERWTWTWWLANYHVTVSWHSQVLVIFQSRHLMTTVFETGVNGKSEDIHIRSVVVVASYRAFCVQCNRKRLVCRSISMIWYGLKFICILCVAFRVGKGSVRGFFWVDCDLWGRNGGCRKLKII